MRGEFRMTFDKFDFYGTELTLRVLCEYDATEPVAGVRSGRPESCYAGDGPIAEAVEATVYDAFFRGEVTGRERVAVESILTAIQRAFAANSSCQRRVRKACQTHAER